MPGDVGNAHQTRPAGIGDPRVTTAVALGWELSDLYCERRAGPGEPALPDTLPGLRELAPRQRVQAGIARASVLIDRVLALLPEGAWRPSADPLREVPEDDAGAWARAVYDLHVQLVTALQAHDVTLTLFHAYDLGRALADTCREPEDLSSLIDRLEPERLLGIESRLADLSSRLPPHAAAAVAATLQQWKGWTVEARARESMAGVRGALARQSALWRALLTGEKDARQMLDPDSYVAASVRHASRLGTMIRGLAGAYLPAAAVLALVTILVLWVIVAGSAIATVIAALGALAATLVVIRKCVALTLEDTIAELRVQLWGAEIDAAVAQSVLRLPAAAPAAKRPKLALAKSAVDGERTTITQRVERALHVTHSAKRQGLRVPASGPETAAAPQVDESASANGNHAP